ncbi:MAG TPA: hypothetical protein VHY83_12850 [Solirubrobacteraceae bacterium]|nr:hypothetical protein [Solirubrobacteraceae bacterium]
MAKDHTGPSDGHGDAEGRISWPLVLVRYVLPAAVVIAGIVVMSLGGETDLEGGAGIVGAGIAIFFVNWLFRVGASGERERDAEDAAREHFDRTGRWPD